MLVSLACLQILVRIEVSERQPRALLRLHAWPYSTPSQQLQSLGLVLSCAFKGGVRLGSLQLSFFTISAAVQQLVGAAVTRWPGLHLKVTDGMITADGFILTLPFPRTLSLQLTGFDTSSPTPPSPSKVIATQQVLDKFVVLPTAPHSPDKASTPPRDSAPQHDQGAQQNDGAAGPADVVARNLPVLPRDPFWGQGGGVSEGLGGFGSDTDGDEDTFAAAVGAAGALDGAVLFAQWDAQDATFVIKDAVAVKAADAASGAAAVAADGADAPDAGKAAEPAADAGAGCVRMGWFVVDLSKEDGPSVRRAKQHPHNSVGAAWVMSAR